MVNKKKTIPEINTTPKAVCQSTPCPITRVYVKKAFNPIPGAIAKGTLAHSPANNVPMAAATTVTVISAALSIPASPKIEGLTKMI